jgi:hypothetical protein
VAGGAGRCCMPLACGDNRGLPRTLAHRALAANLRAAGLSVSDTTAILGVFQLSEAS